MKVLAHLDDVGSSHGSVVAWKGLRAAGVVRSASVMVPCPWYPLARDDWQDEPDQDMGVHITLTSEWSTYRWRPLTGLSGGLTDDEGFMHRRPHGVLASADPEAVADEIAAQIERVLSDGCKPTHLDAHMGTALLPPFVWKLIDTGKYYDVPVLACRDLSPLIRDVGLSKIDAGFVAEVLAEVENQNWPIFDRFLIGFCQDDMAIEDHVAGLLSEADVGLAYYGLHADTAQEIEAFAPQHKNPRRKEYDFFNCPTSANVFAAAGAKTVTWADVTA